MHFRYRARLRVVLTCALMQSGEGLKPSPQFETAEFQAQPGANACFVCHQPVFGSYFRVNARMACSACTERLRSSIPKDSHAAFVRAVTFGAGAAVAGLALYATVSIVTGLMIGYVSLAVGWMVGNAMMKGSGGIGGRRYQVVALILTYAAVSVAAIPIGIAEYIKGKKPQVQSNPQLSAPAPDANAGTGDQPQGSETQAQNPTEHRSRGFVSALGYLAMMGLASPFLELGSDPFHGLIGLVILLVGVRIAWRITQGRPPLVVDGPF
jgi:hypothetical protein